MSSAGLVKALEKKLEEAGEKLLHPPSSVEQLIPLLDKIENSLAKVEQSPAKSIHTVLAPLMKALVADELLRHPDNDVKVAVASCISEITRITAPDAPYDDDKMKEVLQLIVSSFEHLADKPSKSYRKSALILEIVAKVRSCVIMLDLECDELITEMFRIFFRTIRDYHPDNIFLSMETIMSLVVEESEEVPTELLTILLSSVKIDNEGVPPIARRLGERVFESCAVKLKPYLIEAMKSSDISLDGYSKIVTSVYEGTVGQDTDDAANAATATNVANAAKEQLGDRSKPATSSNEIAQEAKDVEDGSCQEDVDPSASRSSKPTMSNGITETRKEGSSGRLESIEKGEQETDKTSEDELTPKPESDDSGAENSTMSESKLEKTGKKRGKMLSSSSKSKETSNPSCADDEKESEKLPGNRESHDKDADSSATEDACPEEEAMQLEKEKDISDIEADEVAEVASPSSSEGVADESLPKRGGRQKKKETLVQVAKKASERKNDSEAKLQKRSGKKAPRETTSKDKTSGEVGTSKNEDVTSSDSEAKPLKQLGKKLDASESDEDGLSIKKKDMKKRGRGKSSMEKHTTKSSTKNDVKEMVSSPKSPAKSTKEEDHLNEIRIKRKRTPGKDKASGKMVYGKNLVGSKVKVWWPTDRMFYEGVIEAFDHIKKKHKVSYNDGDEEVLNLRKERWEFVGDDAATDLEDEEEEEAEPEPEPEPASPDDSSEMHRKKKTKRSADSSLKHERDEVSPKRKLKGTASKSAKKPKVDDKPSPKSRDDSSDDEIVIKSKALSKALAQKSSGKSFVDTPKSSGKSKILDSNASKSKSNTKTASKSKEDDAKTSGKAKGKTPQSVDKSGSSGSSKMKSSSSKVKDSGDVKEKTNNVTKTPEASKSKLSDTSKDRETETKSSKKRHRK